MSREKWFASQDLFLFCCSKLLRWPAEHALSTRTSASSAIHLSIVRRDVSIGGSSVVDPATTSDGDADVDVGVVVVGGDSGGDGGGVHDDDSSFNGVNGIIPRCESTADASAARDTLW